MMRSDYRGLIYFILMNTGGRYIPRLNHFTFFYINWDLYWELGWLVGKEKHEVVWIQQKEKKKRKERGLGKLGGLKELFLD